MNKNELSKLIRESLEDILQTKTTNIVPEYIKNQDIIEELSYMEFINNNSISNE